LRKFSNRREKGDEEVLSDFHREMHPFVEKFVKLLCEIEPVLIRKNISLPFGVSLYGTAQKRG